ncbi:MAG: outer membrane beta-barrel protein [Chitinophagales bacterium]|nr:outer membrane beta-barrel protein [Chitinophagales bacterium]
MKPILYIILVCSIFCCNSLSAQHFTLRAAGGYGWNVFMKSSDIMGPKVDPYTPEKDALVVMANITHPHKGDSAYKYQPIRDSYARGMNFSFAFGYNINPYIGVEMGLTYVKSANISCTQIYPLVYQPYYGAPFAYTNHAFTAKISTSASTLSLMPSVIVQAAKPGWIVYPYARLGLNLPVFGMLNHEVNIHIDDSAFIEAPTLANLLNKSPYFLGNNTTVKLKTEGTVSLGVTGAIGIAYKPKPFINVFAEINGQYLAVRAKQTHVTEWKADGVDKIEERGKYRTEFVYHDNLTENSNNGSVRPPNDNPETPNYDPNKPKDDIRPIGPFSNLGLNVGVTFFLSKETVGKKKKKE